MEQIRKDVEDAKEAAARAQARQARAKVALGEVELEQTQVKAELARIEELPEVSQSDLVARENGRRKLRDLDRRLAPLRKELGKAEAEKTEAEATLDRAEALVEARDLRAKALEDAKSIGELVFGLEATLRERLSTHKDLVDRANRAHWRTLSDDQALRSSARARETEFSGVPLEPSESMLEAAMKAAELMRARGMLGSAANLSEGQSEAMRKREERLAAESSKFAEEWSRKASVHPADLLLPGQEFVRGS